MKATRVVSGMRPTGKLHLGHLVGALQNWVRLQSEYDCFYFVADWHALTSGYADTATSSRARSTTSPTGLAPASIPEKSTFFVQSLVPEHAELYLLLQMVTPIPWLERVPTYKEQIEQLADRDLSSIGFLGYPLLQTADVIIYNAHLVPVGDDQVPHLELSARSCAGSTISIRRGIRRAGAAAHADAALARPRQPEDEQELRQHDRPVGRCADGHEKGAADVHGPQARACRHPGRSRATRCSLP